MRRRWRISRTAAALRGTIGVFLSSHRDPEILTIKVSISKTLLDGVSLNEADDVAKLVADSAAIAIRGSVKTRINRVSH